MKSNIILVPYLEVPVSCVQCHQSVVPTLEIPRSPACNATNMHIVSCVECHPMAVPTSKSLKDSLIELSLGLLRGVLPVCNAHAGGP